MSTAAAAATLPPPTAPAAVTTEDTAPPMAALWAIANRLPATTLPIPACSPAAIEPNSSVRGYYYYQFIGRGKRTSDGPSGAEANHTETGSKHDRCQNGACGDASGTEGSSYQD